MATPPVPSLIPIMFLARPEEDGTLTLILDATGTETLPVELGRGFVSADQIVQAIVDSLTAPAVAEDRILAIEESVQPVNQLIDLINEHDQIADDHSRRLEVLEAVVSQLQAQAPAPVYVRPAIPRIGGGSSAGSSIITAPRSDLRRASEPRPFSSPVTAGPAARPQRAMTRGLPGLPPAPPRPPNVPETPPVESFSRGNFNPHQPVGGVGRGPGSTG